MQPERLSLWLRQPLPRTTMLRAAEPEKVLDEDKLETALTKCLDMHGASRRSVCTVKMRVPRGHLGLLTLQ